MTIINTSRAESWDKIYSAFNNINFTAFTFDTVKESLIQYLQIYYPESFNDFIESSELIAIIECFAAASEQLAYRTDLVAHENFMPTAQRKQSVLRLAKLISYSASRNIPARGLVKINSIRTDETVFDSLGNNLAGVTVTWNDPNNSNWKEQFFLVMNLILTSNYGQPTKSFQVADVLMQLYTFNNTQNSFKNGVYPFSATATTTTVGMEAVPADLNENGPFERAPDLNSQFNIIYASDGRGDGSDYTGFLMFVKQGSMVLTNYTITDGIANRRIQLNQSNVNNTDVWLYEVDEQGSIIRPWVQVDSLADQTLSFNNQSSDYKYEVETLENDQIALLFGDGNFSAIPVGRFQLWTRVSVNQNISIPKSSISGQALSFTYGSSRNTIQNCAVSFSLTSAIQNNSASETIEHVRQAAPSTYYAQNRMVNGQDYNTFPLKDPTILRLNVINRTFAGQPKYIEWNDASGAYQNIKLFGDDLTLKLNTSVSSVQTVASSRGLVDTFFEPALSTNALLNVLTHQMQSAADYVSSGVAHVSGYGIISYPRRKFIEDNRKRYYDVNGNFVTPYGIQLDGNPLQVGDGSLLEKTVIQGALDGHWYGEPLSTVTIGGTVHGLIPDPFRNPESDGKLWITDLPRTIDGISTYPPGDTGSGLQPIQRQKYFGLKYNRFLKAFGNGSIGLLNPDATGSSVASQYVPAKGLPSYQNKVEVFTIELQSDGNTFTVVSNLRGNLPVYRLSAAASTANGRWSEQISIAAPIDFIITPGATAFEPGDSFVIDVVYNTTPASPSSKVWTASVRKFGQLQLLSVNLNGWWQLIPTDVITAPVEDGGVGLFAGGPNEGPNVVQQTIFDQSTLGSSWIFLVSRADDSAGGVLNWTIYNRDMKIVASSPTTKFWFNTNSQIIDSQTLLPLYDKIRILRSNIDETGYPLKKSDIYDCVGFVYDDSGVVESNSLELLPTNTINFAQIAGSGTPSNILQFENFALGSYRYVLYDVTNPSSPVELQVLDCGSYVQETGFQTNPYNPATYDLVSTTINVDGFTGTFVFQPGNFMSNIIGTYQLSRQLYCPAPATINPVTSEYGCNAIGGLDFMWQHYTPDANLIDPTPSNIHDAYILTQGYYTSMIDYVRGLTTIPPQPPTPLDLRTSYGYLLENAMLSDTVVLHPGKVKLLFGSLADQTLRAKFRVVVSPTATFSKERIQQEVINVINTYFNIENWDFGDTFYATELISLIHQALPTQISSVVLVPTYSVNSFGSLFTIDSGLDEVLQSCAQVSDVEIVSALTPSILRQS